ncbi:MAG: cupin domain-containing protein [Anaerolineales bacterium]|nr:cupin domain-containing protein [Anaerolineales bacterium]
MHPKVKALIEKYNFQPLPAEGTLFVSTYRSASEFENGKPHGTAMLGMYCDDPKSLSLFHRLTADEVWHFYGGDPLRLVLLYPDGSSKEIILSSENVQAVIPAGVWQAGHMVAGGAYSLFGCTVAPGFTGDMFEGGAQSQLLKLYPDRAADIQKLGIATDETHMPKGFAP